MRESRIGIEPFDENYLEPATYDVRVGDLAAVSTASKPIDLREHRLVPIEPGAMAILQSLEVLSLSTEIAARLGPKTSLLRRGVFVSTGPQVDPGFKGRLIVNLINLSPRTFTLRHADPFLSVEFHQLSDSPDKAYSGEYQGRMELSPEELDSLLAYQGPTLAELHRSFGQLRDNIRDVADFLPVCRALTEVLERDLASRATPVLGFPATTMHIEGFGVEPYDVIRPIPVTLQREGDTFVAGFFEANIHAGGDTEQEAFDNLTSLLLDVYESLESETAELGPDPRRQLGTLKRYMKRTA